MTKTPTHESFTEFEAAFAHFNAELFSNKLPQCLITLHRHKSARGYFWAEKFERSSGERVVDEIAMNPDCFKGRTDTETLSTLVHEMVHLQQKHFGKPSRNGYHNKEWAGMMDMVGLTPSTTAAPGGKRTGQNCSHYIVTGGPFSVACAKLIKTGFVITWRSRPKAPIAGKSGKRIKYECDECGAAAWGKEGLNIECGDCGITMAEL